MAESTAAPSLTPIEARQIARDAYIYGFPIVDGYRIIHAYAVDRNSPQYTAPFNEIASFARVFTPEDKVIQTPNSDTPYSFVVMDLRAEPIVLTLPVVEKGRYFSVQLIDLYTHNFDYLGSRTTGNEGGSFVIAGPDWKGETPAGIKKVLRSETQIVLAVYRTQLFNPADIDNVKRVQAGYKVQTLSEFLGTPSADAATKIDFIKPLTPDQQRTSLEFFGVLNFLLQFCPPHPSEKELMARFAKLGIGADASFDEHRLSAGIRKGMEAGVSDAWEAFAELKKRADAGEVTSGDVFGAREFLRNNYLYRMAAAVIGIYGNSKQEAMYPVLSVDSHGQQLNGSENRYSLRFAQEQLPPVNAFWSLTMYELPASLLVTNSLNRYLINSPMLPNLKRDADGGLTLYIQKDPPGKEKESNWLPAPNGPFIMFLRLYWPKPEALEGEWVAPTVEVVQTAQAA